MECVAALSSGMYEQILVPTDGSDASKSALREAIALARDQDAGLHVLHVVELAALEPVYGGDIAIESLEEAGERAVEESVAAAEEAGLQSIEGTSVRGVAHEEIVDYVDDRGMELVVVGTHGRTGLDRVLLGSVAEKVVRLSPVPVLTVRPGEGG